MSVGLGKAFFEDEDDEEYEDDYDGPSSIPS
jgi:hypothetical protein